MVQELQKEMEEEFPNCNSQAFFLNECVLSGLDRIELMCVYCFVFSHEIRYSSR